MSPTGQCRVVGEQALVDLVLGELPATARLAVRRHAETCAVCGDEVRRLADDVAALLLVAPAVDVPDGFADRAVQRWSSERRVGDVCRTARIPVRARRHRRLHRVAAVVAVAALVALGALLLPDADHGRFVDLRATGTAEVAGVAELSNASPDDQVAMTVDRRLVGEAYRCVVVLTDGSVVELGEFDGDRAGWSGPLPAPIDAVRELQVVDEHGRVLATGALTR